MPSPRQSTNQGHDPGPDSRFNGHAAGSHAGMNRHHELRLGLVPRPLDSLPAMAPRPVPHFTGWRRLRPETPLPGPFAATASELRSPPPLPA